MPYQIWESICRAALEQSRGAALCNGQSIFYVQYIYMDDVFYVSQRCQFFYPTTPKLAELRRTQPSLVAQACLENIAHWVQYDGGEHAGRRAARMRRIAAVTDEELVDAIVPRGSALDCGTIDQS